MRNALLALLAAGPAHGYELKQAYERALGIATAPVNIGQVYTTLQRLERDALVIGRDVAQADRPNKTVYELTQAGRSELEAWYAASASAPRLRDEFVTRFMLAHATGMTDPLALLDRQRAAYLRALRNLEPLQPDGGNSLLTGLLIEGAALHLQADLRWLDRCEELLTRKGRP